MASSNKKQMAKSSTGFTLIELLVVISIIALLSSIVLASMNSARDKANNTAIKLAITSYIQAIRLYQVDNNDNLPTDSTGGQLVLPSNPNRELFSICCLNGNTCTTSSDLVYFYQPPYPPYAGSGSYYNINTVKSCPNFRNSMEKYLPKLVNFSSVYDYTNPLLPTRTFAVRNHYFCLGFSAENPKICHEAVIVFGLFGANQNCNIPGVDLQSEYTHTSNIVNKATVCQISISK